MPDPLPDAAVDAPWSTSDAEALYHVPTWGSAYFFVNDAGHAAVRPLHGSDTAIDLHEVAERLRRAGVKFPALIRLQDLLQARVAELNEAFRQAVEATGYDGTYRGVYPIKVNQLREVVEEIVEAGAPYDYGLECGSKAELVAALPYLRDDAMLLICNGYKDAVMMRLMLSAQQLGKTVLPVIERYAEFELLLRLADELAGDASWDPSLLRFGVRVRLSTAGAGLWSESGGENSKFGLSLTELLQLLERLQASGYEEAFQLLHFHLGSQIAELRTVRQAAEEAGRLYADLRGRGLPVRFLDIGGGLGVSYEASHPDALGHIDYTLPEFAHAVVETLHGVCTREDVPPPTIVSESGRAVTAPHSVLVVETVGTRAKDRVHDGGDADDDDHPVLGELAYLLDDLRQGAGALELDDLQGSYQTAEAMRRQAGDLFRRGQLDLVQKARAERLYWSACHHIHEQVQHLHPTTLPGDLAALHRQLADQYLCDFSVFRSLVDHWAIGQRFPIMPLHRLDEAPERRGILVDLTCDSDGKVASFASPEGSKPFLELHALRPGERYTLGVFLMGAYQDIMGDMHNLFGRVTEAHVYVDDDEPGHFYIEKILQGADVQEQLALVQYHPHDLERRMNELIQQSVKAGRIRPREGVGVLDQYKRAFAEYTYLDLDAR